MAPRSGGSHFLDLWSAEADRFEEYCLETGMEVGEGVLDVNVFNPPSATQIPWTTLEAPRIGWGMHPGFISTHWGEGITTGRHTGIAG